MIHTRSLALVFVPALLSLVDLPCVAGRLSMPQQGNTIARKSDMDEGMALARRG